MSKDKLSLEQALQSYRVMHTPTRLSWKQHWVNETFSDSNILKCPEDEKKQYTKRLKECRITICPNIQSLQGCACTMNELLELIINPNNEFCNKTNRKVVYGSANGDRPTGKNAFLIWNGFQVIDLDIKDEDLAKKLKYHLFKKLHKCNWFMGVVLSSSGKGLHIYTKISVPQTEEEDFNKKKLLFYANFRHKYSFVYLSLLHGMEEYGYDKARILSWLYISMCKPAQGAFIPYDPDPLISSRFFEEFIYVCFDSVEDIGHPDVDWVAHPDLKTIFKRWEWFEDESDDIKVNVLDKPKPEFDTHNKVHYKHHERWRLANTLVHLYGEHDGYEYLRNICSNNVKDKELLADCITAKRYKKPVDVWAVNRLNSVHGFKIKLDIPTEEFNEDEIFKSVDNIDNPTMIVRSKYEYKFHINEKQYLGNIKYQILDRIGRVSLLEAGPGLGKTEMVKSIVRDGKKILMVMPFTSTIKAKVEQEEGWYYSYGSKSPKLDVERGLCVTVDKFSRMNMMEIKAAGFDYIFIDESHLLFMSEYRPVMPKVIEMIRNTEVPVILMSGTPTGELIFIQDIVHIRVTKDDNRKKELQITLVDSTSDLMFHMCQQMARDIVKGRRILFPTNAGTLYSKQIHAAVTYFLENEHMYFEPVNLKYYKKSNSGEEFMDDINFENTIKDVNILLCSSYLSVGVDILDRLNFSVYFGDLMMPQEIDQFTNRLRSLDLYIKMFVAKNDAEGNSRLLHKYRDVDFKLNEEELKNIHSILKICNKIIERNPQEYRYNPIVLSIVEGNKFIERNESNNRYYLNDIAYKATYFERKYREYVEQLPVMIKGMQAYGYNVSIVDLKEFRLTGSLMFRDLKDLVKLAYDNHLMLDTTHIQELMDMINENSLPIYKEVLNGMYDIKKSDKWLNDRENHVIFVKNIEVFEKVVPLFISMSKRYDTNTIKDIFEFCRRKNGTYNFAAIKRIKLLINLMYNDKTGRLDIPIQQYMKDAYEFSDLKTVHKSDIVKFNKNWALKYATMESGDGVIIPNATMTMETLEKTFTNIFKCLINTTRPGKDGIVNMERVDLIWQERESETNRLNEAAFLLADFLGNNVIDTEIIEENVKELVETDINVVF